jgi:hypothetical protein
MQFYIHDGFESSNGTQTADFFMVAYQTYP